MLNSANQSVNQPANQPFVQRFAANLGAGVAALTSLAVVLFVVAGLVYGGAYGVAWAVSSLRPEDYHAEVTLKSVDFYHDVSYNPDGPDSVSEGYKVKIDELPNEEFDVKTEDIDDAHLTAGSKVRFGYKRVLNTKLITTWEPLAER